MALLRGWSIASNVTGLGDFVGHASCRPSPPFVTPIVGAAFFSFQFFCDTSLHLFTRLIAEFFNTILVSWSTGDSFAFISKKLKELEKMEVTVELWRFRARPHSVGTSPPPFYSLITVLFRWEGFGNSFRNIYWAYENFDTWVPSLPKPI